MFACLSSNWRVAIAAWAVVVGAQFLCRSAPAQEPPPKHSPATIDQQPAPAPPQTSEEEIPLDADVEGLIETLIESEPADDDIAWLLSDPAEYAEPTALAGKPIPAPGLPQRGEGSRRTWDPRWRTFALGNYLLTGTAIAAGMSYALIPPQPTRWRGRNSFDEAVRGGIGIKDLAEGVPARDASDLLLSFSIAYPLLLDSLIVTYWHRQSHAVAAQMALISAEAIAVAGAVQGLTAGFASRQRPYGRNCGRTIDEGSDFCEGRRRYRSFFSGHAAMAFAAASVSCSHHARHDVFGDPTADALSCATTMTAAAAVGTLRIVGDQHYASDVIVGAGIGTMSGLGIPWLLHYGPWARRPEPSARSAFSWHVVGVPNGMGIGGKF